MMLLFMLLLTGCSAKLPFCKSNPCQNGGTCRVSWETFSCDCPLGYGGKDCSHGERLNKFIFIQGSYLFCQFVIIITSEIMTEIIGSFSPVPVVIKVLMF